MNFGLCLYFFGLLSILSLISCSRFAKGCKSCFMNGLSGRHCIQQEIMCDGYKDCLGGADESGCGENVKHCTVIHYIGKVICPSPLIIEVDDAWLDNQWHCVRHGTRQSFNSNASTLCNNKQSCNLPIKRTQSVKILYHCNDNAEPTGQAAKLFRNYTQIGPKLTSKNTNNIYKNQISHSTTRVHMPLLAHGKDAKENVTSHSHAHQSSNHSFNKQKKLAVNNNQTPTHMMHINKTFVKHDSVTNNPRHESQGYIFIAVAAIAGSVTGGMLVIGFVLSIVAVRRHIIKRNARKCSEGTTQTTSHSQPEKFSDSLEGQNDIPLYSCVDKLRQGELGKTMPQSKSISNIGYDEVSEFGVQYEDYDHIERVGRREDVDMVYSLTTYQKTEDDYDISGNFNESLRSYQENSIYD